MLASRVRMASSGGGSYYKEIIVARDMQNTGMTAHYIGGRQVVKGKKYTFNDNGSAALTSSRYPIGTTIRIRYDFGEYLYNAASIEDYSDKHYARITGYEDNFVVFEVIELQKIKKPTINELKVIEFNKMLQNKTIYADPSYNVYVRAIVQSTLDEIGLQATIGTIHPFRSEIKLTNIDNLPEGLQSDLYFVRGD